MRAHKKWLNETLTDERAKKFELETANVSTMDEIILAVSETSWRGALEWIYKEARKLEKQPESPIDAFDLIEEELK